MTAEQAMQGMAGMFGPLLQQLQSQQRVLTQLFESTDCGGRTRQGAWEGAIGEEASRSCSRERGLSIMSGRKIELTDYIRLNVDERVDEWMEWSQSQKGEISEDAVDLEFEEISNGVQGLLFDLGLGVDDVLCGPRIRHVLRVFAQRGWRHSASSMSRVCVGAVLGVDAPENASARFSEAWVRRHGSAGGHAAPALASVLPSPGGQSAGGQADAPPPAGPQDAAAGAGPQGPTAGLGPHSAEDPTWRPGDRAFDLGPFARYRVPEGEPTVEPAGGGTHTRGGAKWGGTLEPFSGAGTGAPSTSNGVEGRSTAPEGRRCESCRSSFDSQRTRRGHVGVPDRNPRAGSRRGRCSVRRPNQMLAVAALWYASAHCRMMAYTSFSRSGGKGASVLRSASAASAPRSRRSELRLRADAEAGRGAPARLAIVVCSKGCADSRAKTSSIARCATEPGPKRHNGRLGDRDLGLCVGCRIPGARRPKPAHMGCGRGMRGLSMLGAPNLCD